MSDLVGNLRRPVFSERGSYIKQLSQYLDEAHCRIIAGDFNCVLNGMMDRRPSSCHNDQGNSDLVEMMIDFNLVNIFQKKVPN